VRIVLDTNILLPAFFGSGLCHTLLERLLESDDAEIVTSEHILGEFRQYATGKFKAPARDVDEAIRLLRSAATVVQPAEIDKDAFSDPDDLPVLGTAIAADTAVLVTGDKDMLALNQFRGIPILSPRAVYEQLH